jgi:hypothetical protein
MQLHVRVYVCCPSLSFLWLGVHPYPEKQKGYWHVCRWYGDPVVPNICRILR